MASQLPFIFRASPLPSNFKGTPQDFLDALVERLSAESEVEIAVFVTGSVEPSSNVGPWLKDGTTWYVWDDVSGSYIPQIIEQSSLGYIISDTAPDHNVYQFWIETSGGSPRAVKTWFSGAWVDVYANTLSGYLTIAAFNTAIANYYTKAETDAAIAAAIAAIPSVETYPAQAEQTAGPQSITLGAAATKCNLNSAPINPTPNPFNVVNKRYIAPADGIYSASVIAVFDNNTGTPAGMEITLRLYVNGVDSGLFASNNTPSPNGDQWTLVIPANLLNLSTNDYVEFFAEATDGVDSGAINLTNIDASFFRVSS